MPGTGNLQETTFVNIKYSINSDFCKHNNCLKLFSNQYVNQTSPFSALQNYPQSLV